MNRFSSIFLRVALVLSVSFAGAAVSERNQRHLAKVIVEMVYDKDPEGALRKHLPKDDPSVTFVKQRNTGLFEIHVMAETRKAAAKRANEIALSVKRAFDNEGTYGGFVIREFAEPRTGPAGVNAAAAPVRQP